MRKVLSRSLLTAASTAGVLAAAAGYAQADSGAGAATSNSPGVGSGNAIQVPIEVPLNACGNSVSVVGVLNPVFGNSCANADGATAPAPPREEASEPERHAPPERAAEEPAPEQAAPANVTERTSSTRQAPPQEAPEKAPEAAPQTEPAGKAHFAGTELAETGSAGVGAATALGAGVLIGGVVLYRRSSRRA